MGTWRTIGIMATTSLLGFGCSEPDTISASDDSFIKQLAPLEFDGACETGDQLTIAAVGDVLLHGRLQQQAYAAPDGFQSLWSQASELMRAADVTYANLEGPTAPGVRAGGGETTDPGKSFDGVVYTSYPQFNYHPSLLDDLIDSGVDVVSTANNHSLDRSALGADRTIDELRERGLPFTGTHRRDESGAWATITETKGFRLAWIACTYGTNGIVDHHGQVALCWEDKAELLDEVAQLRARDDIDAVIATPHWGNEYERSPNTKQKDLAHELLDAGATLVIGAHPHVLQPWERYVTVDGREGFVMYSLGNFVSGQRHLHRRATMILNVGLTRRSNGDVIVNGARYVPLNMGETSAGLALELLDRNGGSQDSRAATVEMFGLFNLAAPTAPVRTNPQCDASWAPPIAQDGWIGGSCTNDDVCGGGTCDSAWLGGHCSQSCDKVCPDASGRASTFCVDDGGGEGVCVLKCATDADCRDGYTCSIQPRHNEPSTEAKVCLPR